MSTKAKEESPLANIIINVLLPVIILTHMSKERIGFGEDDKFWHVGPLNALFIAIAIPLVYGIYHFIKTKEFNLFSGIGVLSVLLTGGVTLYLWNEDGSVKPDAALWFGLKEAIQPLILGGVVLASHWTKSPLFREFIYNDGIFDVPRVEKKVEELGKMDAYKQVVFRNTLIFCGSFLISAILNMFLAQHFLGALDFTAENARELYNQGVAKITGWGFVVIGLPLFVLAAFIIFRHAKDLQKLTGLEKEEVLLLGS